MFRKIVHVAAAALIASGTAHASAVTFNADSAIGRGSDHSAWMPFFENLASTPMFQNANGSDFDFAPSGTLTLRDDYSGTLSGLLVSQVDPSYSMRVTIELCARSGAGSGGPKMELPGSAYVDAGGPIDPATWSYHDLVGGTMVGEGALDGVSFSVSERPYNSVFPMQIGDGANGKNENFGLAVWFYLTADSNCTAQVCSSFAGQTYGGDFNLDLNATPTPLPAGGILFLTGIAGAIGLRGRRQSAQR